MHGVYSLIVMKHWKTIHTVEGMEYCKMRKTVWQVQDNVHCVTSDVEVIAWISWDSYVQL